MKKILSLVLISIFLLGSSAAAVSLKATAEPSREAQSKSVATKQNKLYLVPGTYMSEGAKVENAVPAGAAKLTAEECAEILTDNVYLCNLSAGDALPVPTSSRKDKNGVPYQFNGWWSIVDATVTYFDKMPELSETLYLYADWRAELSQRKDPVIPDESTVAVPSNYMSIKRAATGKEEIITLRISGTDDINADTLGYYKPVQLYNDWFELNPGDVITVYATGLGGSDQTQSAPLDVAGNRITFENSTTTANNTGTYLKINASDTRTLAYRATQKTQQFRIYIKFKSNGAEMLVYMEPKN